jgi:hypothetical protein
MSRVFLCLFSAALATAQSNPPGPAQRQAHWREDLEYFAAHFSSGHCTSAGVFRSPLTAFEPCHQADFAKLYPQPAFSNGMHAIEETIPNLTDSQIILRLARLVASAHAGHTHVQIPSRRLGFLPLPDFRVAAAAILLFCCFTSKSIQEKQWQSK